MPSQAQPIYQHKVNDSSSYYEEHGWYIRLARLATISFSPHQSTWTTLLVITKLTLMTQVLLCSADVSCPGGKKGKQKSATKDQTRTPVNLHWSETWILSACLSEISGRESATSLRYQPLLICGWSNAKTANMFLNPFSKLLCNVTPVELLKNTT